MYKKITVKIAQSSEDLKSVFEVRRKVFVDEQSVDESEEYDDYEVSSIHLLAELDGEVVATCRYRNTTEGIKLERFAVLKPHRGCGVGYALVTHVLNEIDLTQYIYLHAQVQVVEFYEKFGFMKRGNQFEEANIKHFKMVYKKK